MVDVRLRGFSCEVPTTRVACLLNINGPLRRQLDKDWNCRVAHACWLGDAFIIFAFAFAFLKEVRFVFGGQKQKIRF